ncbi:uncharacterized protein LOC106760189 isoform X2 [Vigna radiata var. radiata]|uniref:Uncharacterized protein LOC106760189 isoform X2 n=1 Tax=Vigna radiata var. radiata TaxID=3916 RepID=A0A1S3TZD8_VIGRR|nr:uncharacterized protein LOC106760189 isoform X2 [Vigna radiata var. radiata]
MKFLSWMQTKISGKQDNRKPDTYTTTTYDGKQEGREEFSDWPDGLLAIGTFGNNKEAIEKCITTKEEPSSSEQIPDFTLEEIGKLQKELTKLLRQKPKVEKEIAHLPLDRFLNCPSSLEVDRRISNVVCTDSENKDDHDEEEEKQEREEDDDDDEEDIEKTLGVILGKFKEICAKKSKKAIGKKSISFLLKKMFVCRSGFSPTSSLRDTLQLQESRMEKLLRTILHKKINTQHSSRALSLKRLEDRRKMPMEEEAEAETDDGGKWVKTDSEYIVLEI